MLDNTCSTLHTKSISEESLALSEKVNGGTQTTEANTNTSRQHEAYDDLALTRETDDDDDDDAVAGSAILAPHFGTLHHHHQTTIVGNTTAMCRSVLEQLGGALIGRRDARLVGLRLRKRRGIGPEPVATLSSVCLRPRQPVAACSGLSPPPPPFSQLCSCAPASF